MQIGLGAQPRPDLVARRSLDRGLAGLDAVEERFPRMVVSRIVDPQEHGPQRLR